MTYEESVSFLDEIGKGGSHYGLDSILGLLEQLGNPQDKLKVLHVAGTNGKGSVSNMLSSILIENNLKIGLFNSPNILSYRETIKLNNIEIPQTDFAFTATLVQSACNDLISLGAPHPTAFECYTALAIVYFTHQAVDIAIIEAGLGGTLDATNVFNTPLASVITSISFDHMDYLGHTLSAIATAKAGIIKYKSPVVISANPEQVLKVLFEHANSHHAPQFYIEEKDIHLTIYRESLEGMTFSISTPYFTYNQLHTKLIGAHQLMNMTTALMVIEVLKTFWHYPISEQAIKAGMAKNYWSCRCEYLKSPVAMLIDGAHNESSLEGLLEVLNKHCNNKPITFLFGVLKDKEVDKMLSRMATFSDTIFITEPLSPRALHLSELFNKCTSTFAQVFSFTDAIVAFEEAVLYAKKTNTFLCCVGSLYLSIPLRAHIEKTYV